MHQGKLVFAQLMVHLPLSTFRRCVADHNGEHKVKDFWCLDQFFAMAFAQLTYRESLRVIEVNLRAQARRLYHMGFPCQTISRNTMANANATGPFRSTKETAASKPAWKVQCQAMCCCAKRSIWPAPVWRARSKTLGKSYSAVPARPRL